MRTKRKQKKPKPFSQRSFREKQCLSCPTIFAPISGGGKYCAKCKPAIQKLKERENRQRKRRASLDALGPQQCWYCGEMFLPTLLRPRTTCNKCSGAPRANGQAGTYLVQGMLVSEFAFFTIMAQQGVELEYIGLNGAWFEVPGSHFRPDFKRPHTDIYYEVVGSRQRYHQARHKYEQFRALYPHLTLIVVRPDGTEIHEDR